MSNINEKSLLKSDSNKDTDCHIDLKAQKDLSQLLDKQLQEANKQLEEINRDLEQTIARSNQMAVESELISIELEQIFNTAVDGMWIIEEDFSVRRVNKTFLKMLNTKAEDVVFGKCYEIFKGNICRTKRCPLVKLLNSKDVNQLEYDIEHKFTRDISTPLILTATPFRGIDNQIIGIVENFRDITKRKQVEHELKEANIKLKKLATTDGLTQVANRRLFDETLRKEWRRMARYNKPLSLIMCDIDFFKLFNDTYGHQVGDKCLKSIAKTVKSCLRRAGDLVARYGGEEFVMILPDTSNENAMQVASLIRQSVEDLKIFHIMSKVSRYVTISLGVSTIFPSIATLPDLLIRRADSALYEAKESGKNRVVLR